jgi:hypothetical protein
VVRNETPAPQPDEPQPASEPEPGFKDSDPIPESEWAPPADERPYHEAITSEHREHLAEFGLEPKKS